MGIGTVPEGVMNMNRAERRRIETHQRLFEALRDELATSGLDATTVQAVTDRADVALGTFYNHFEDKEAAIRALADVELAAIRTARGGLEGHSEELPRFMTTTFATVAHKASVDRRWIRFLDALVQGGWWPGLQVHAMYIAFATDARQRSMIGVSDADWAAKVMETLLATFVRHLATDAGVSNPSASLVEALRSVLGALDVPADVVAEEVRYAMSLPQRLQWPDDEMVRTSIDLGMSRL